MSLHNSNLKLALILALALVGPACNNQKAEQVEEEETADAQSETAPTRDNRSSQSGDAAFIKIFPDGDIVVSRGETATVSAPSASTSPPAPTSSPTTETAAPSQETPAPAETSTGAPQATTPAESPPAPLPTAAAAAAAAAKLLAPVCGAGVAPRLRFSSAARFSLSAAPLVGRDVAPTAGLVDS